MNKKNENDKNNQSQSFHDRLTMFQNKNQDVQAKKVDKNNESEFSIKKTKTNRTIFQPKNIQNFEGNIIKNHKIEEIPKGTNNFLNIINQLNEKEEKNKNKDSKNLEKTEKTDNKNEKPPVKKSSFQQNLSKFPSAVKEKFENKDNSVIKNNKNIQETLSDKKKFQKKESFMIEDKKEVKEILVDKDNGFKKKINLFNQNNNSLNNEIKIDENIKQEPISSRSGSMSVKEKIKLMGDTKKEENEKKAINKEDIFKKKETYQKITNEKKKQEKSSFFQKAKSGNQNIKEKKDEIKDEKAKNSKPPPVTRTSTNPQTINAIKQKILDMQKQNNENNINKNKNKKEDSKLTKGRIDASILDKLKLFYQPKDKNQKQSQENIISNNNNSSINKNVENKFQKKISKNLENKTINEKKIEISNTKEKETNIEQITPIKTKEDEMTLSNNTPRKLNLKEIFKNMNIDQVASNVKERKREEIMKYAQKKNEEESQINFNEKEGESDNENEIENEEKEKEEDLIEDEKEEYNKMLVMIDNHESQEMNEQTENDFFENNVQNLENNTNKIEKNNNSNEEIERKGTLKEITSFLGKMFLERQKSFKNIENKKDLINKKIENKEIIENLEINKNINIDKLKKVKKFSSANMEIQEEKSISKKLNKSISLESNDNDRIENIKKENDLRSTVLSQNSNISLEKSENAEIFLEKESISQNTVIKNDSFCESFFLASFSKENGKILDNTENIKGECNHSICAILPAMQPEIIYKYPKEDTKGLEINNLAASICYPTGIKLCYEENEENIKTVKNYRSSFTNQVGERFFAVIYHFYLKMVNNDVECLYNETPIKHQIRAYQDELYASLNDEFDEEILKKINIYGEINFRKYVYVPYCLCLISKYPFIEQMEKCLESIMMSINNDEKNIFGLNKLIAYIVKSIPAPPQQSKIIFPLPYYNKFVEIQQPFFKDITQFGDNPIYILNLKISPSHILSLFKLIILEQKVLVIGKDNDTISQFILNFISLIYPFEWIHTFIPIMSEKMNKFLQAFLPFFNGMNLSLYEKAKPILAKASKGVYIFNIDDDKIDINSNLKVNAKYIKASAYIKKHFPSLPRNLESLILKELKTIKNKNDFAKEDYDKFNANLRIKSLFIYVFAELLQDYHKYSYIIDDYPVFNSFLMIKDKKSDKKFFKEFTSTQLFQMFIQNSLFKEKDKKSHFEECLHLYMELKNKGLGPSYVYPKLYNNLKKEYLSYFQIKNNYIIKPFFIKEFEKIEEEYINKKKIMRLSNVSLFLSKQYEQQIDINYNYHGVLKENKRIIERPIDLNNDNDPEDFDIFLLPGQDINKLINNNNNQKSDNSKEDGTYKKTNSFKMGIISDEKENNIKMTQCMPNKENDLTEDEKDEIKDNIRETMTRIYRSDVSRLEEDKKTIMLSMEKQFGRDYFVSILNTGNIEERSIKIVIEESYDFFGYVIFNSLLNILKLEENKHNYLCSIKLLKACLCIKTMKNKKEILLSDDLYYKLEDYSFFKKPLFWKYWIEDDLTKNDLQVLQRYKQLNMNFEECYYYDDEESEDYLIYLKHSYEVLDNLTSLMIKMKLKNSFIISIIIDLIKEYIIREKDYQQLMHEVVNELQLYKKLSNLK